MFDSFPQSSGLSLPSETLPTTSCKASYSSETFVQQSQNHFDLPFSIAGETKKRAEEGTFDSHLSIEMINILAGKVPFHKLWWEASFKSYHSILLKRM